MVTITKVLRKIGNSHYLNVDSSIMSKLGLKEGDLVQYEI